MFLYTNNELNERDLRKINIIKIFIIPKVIYSYNAVPTKIAIAFFNVEIQKIFSTGELHVKPRMRSQAANTVMNKNKTGGILKYKVTVIKRVWYLRTNGGKVN